MVMEVWFLVAVKTYQGGQEIILGKVDQYSLLVVFMANNIRSQLEFKI
jgi:hypothetical protein